MMTNIVVDESTSYIYNVFYFSNQQVEHVQYTPTHIKTRNFVQSIINRQYADPSINIRHLPAPDDDEPSTSTGTGATGGLSSGSGLIPAIEGPSTSTDTGAPPTSYMSTSTVTGATGGLSSASGLIPAIEGPSTSTATGVPPLSYMSSGSDFKTYNKNKKSKWPKWLLARDRFNKQLVSNEITVRGLSNTPKAEEEKEVEEGFPASEEKEVDEGSPSSSSSSSSSASASAPTSASVSVVSSASAAGA